MGRHGVYRTTDYQSFHALRLHWPPFHLVLSADHKGWDLHWPENICSSVFLSHWGLRMARELQVCYHSYCLQSFAFPKSSMLSCRASRSQHIRSVHPDYVPPKKKAPIVCSHLIFDKYLAYLLIGKDNHHRQTTGTPTSFKGSGEGVHKFAPISCCT